MLIEHPNRKGLLKYLKNFRNPLDISVDINRKIIYMRTPKTASSSIAVCLKEAGLDFIRRKEKRSEFNKWINKLKEDDLNDYFIFSSIRNPWDRFISNLAYSGSRWNLGILKNKTRLGLISHTRHGIPQKYFTHIDKIPFVNYIIKMENIQEDISYLIAKFNLKYIKIKHINRSNRENYKTYFTDETKQIVANLYKEDIELYGYNY